MLSNATIIKIYKKNKNKNKKIKKKDIMHKCETHPNVKRWLNIPVTSYIIST